MDVVDLDVDFEGINLVDTLGGVDFEDTCFAGDVFAGDNLCGDPKVGVGGASIFVCFVVSVSVFDGLVDVVSTFCFFADVMVLEELALLGGLPGFDLAISVEPGGNSLRNAGFGSVKI